jgi:hypothetical protein
VVKIQFTDLKIGEIKSSSGVFTGTNNPRDWRHYSKKNEGLGPLSGNYNVSMGNRSSLYDLDIWEIIKKQRNIKTRIYNR